MRLTGRNDCARPLRGSFRPVITAVTIAAAVAFAAPARADKLASLTFSNGVFADGSTTSGNIEYYYDPLTDLITGVFSADVSITASTSAPYFTADEFVVDVAGKTTNASTEIYQWVPNSDGVILADSAAGEQIVLAVVGVGADAVLSTTATAYPVPGSTELYSLLGQGQSALTSAGTSSGADVPEPAALGLFGAAVAALGLLRRRRRPA